MLAASRTYLPPLAIDTASRYSMPDTHSPGLPGIRDLFPDLLPTESVSPTAGAHPREIVLEPSRLRSRWATLPPICVESDTEDDVASSQYELSSSEAPTSSPPTPIMHAAPSSPTGAPSCSFDILRQDPASSSLEHVASSKTRWTGIPRLMPSAPTIPCPTEHKNKKLRRVYYAPGLNPAADASRASLASTHGPSPSFLEASSHAKSWGSEHTFAITSSSPTKSPEHPFLEPKVGSTSIQMGWQLTSASPSYVYGPLLSDADPRHVLEPDSSAMGAVRSAARAQAEFEQEVRRAPPLVRAARFHQRQNSKAGSPESAGGTVEGASTSSSTNDSLSSVGQVLDVERSVPPALPVQRPVSTLTALGKPKKPCDLERNHICPRCGRAFNRPSSLRVHGHVHTGFRPFVCPAHNCGRMFSVSSNMRRHLRTHTELELRGASIEEQSDEDDSE